MTRQISVILPTYNSAETVGRALDSVLSQDYPSIEVIVVDDGSTDETIQILERYDGQVTVIQQENSGPSAARNRGLKCANGRFVAFLDSDDYWLPGFLSKCVSALTKSSDAVAVSAMTKAIHWSGRETIIPLSFGGSKSVIEIDDFFGFWATHDHIRTGSVVVDRIVVGDIPFFREDLRVSEDLEYWALLATMGKWLFLPEVLFVTDGRHHSREMTWYQKHQKRRETVPGIEEWEKRLVPRLENGDICGFKKMRGRIARSFAHMNILNHEDLVAREIVQSHGKDFPADRLNRTMLAAAKCGNAGWRILTIVLRIKEAVKVVYMASRAKRAVAGESCATH